MENMIAAQGKLKKCLMIMGKEGFSLESVHQIHEHYLSDIPQKDIPLFIRGPYYTLKQDIGILLSHRETKDQAYGFSTPDGRDIYAEMQDALIDLYGKLTGWITIEDYLKNQHILMQRSEHDLSDD